MRNFSTAKAAPTTKPALALVKRQPDTLDFTKAIIVSREQLEEAYKDVRGVSGVLHCINSLDDLDYDEMLDLCRTAYHAKQLLAAMLEAEGVQAR